MKNVVKILSLVLVVALLALPVSAANFTPSVEQKGAPAAKDPEVVIVPLTDADKASETVQKVMEQVYTDISKAEKLTDVMPALDEALKTRDAKVDSSKLIVTDLFYADSTASKKDETVFVGTNYKQGDFLLVSVFVDGEWVVLDEDMVEITKDGSIVVGCKICGPICFITEITE
ncbi:MAG: hypothetical protein ACI3V1_00540 [Faecousia sp.]